MSVKKSKTGCLIAAIIVGGVVLMIGLVIIGFGSCMVFLSKTPTATPAPTLSTEKFIDACVEFNYDKAAREPEKYEGQNIKLKGQIIQVVKGFNTDYRIALLDANGNQLYDKIVYVKYNLPEGEPRLLENDIVNVYGTSKGTQSYLAIFGQSIELPVIEAKLIKREE